jgi:hypothetical protein
MALLTISPGNSPQFTLTPEPAGIPTSIDNIGWAVESSDGNGNISMTSNADDLSGMTATLAIPPEITIGAVITFWAVYRNPSGTEVGAGAYQYPVVSS